MVPAHLIEIILFHEINKGTEYIYKLRHELPAPPPGAVRKGVIRANYIGLNSSLFSSILLIIPIT